MQWKWKTNLVQRKPFQYFDDDSDAKMMDIATWAQEYFGKSLSLNTVCHCIKKCNLKLYFSKMKAFIHFALKRHRVLWARSHLRPKDSGNVFHEFHISGCFWKKTDIGFYVPKMKKTIQTVTNKRCKTSLFDGRGVHLSWSGLILVHVFLFIVIYCFSYHTWYWSFCSHTPLILPCTHVFSPVTSTSSCPAPCLFCIVCVMVRFGDWQLLGVLLYLPCLLRFVPFSFT